MRCAIVPTAMALFCWAAFAKAADQPLEFEVASLKLRPLLAQRPFGRVGCFGGPGSNDPIRFTCIYASISDMVGYAYDLRPEQIKPPIAADKTRFDLQAKVPPRATREQVRLMLRSLLVDRFKLAFHRESTEVKGFALVVAKGGVKMKDGLHPWSETPS